MRADDLPPELRRPQPPPRPVLPAEELPLEAPQPGRPPEPPDIANVEEKKLPDPFLRRT